MKDVAIAVIAIVPATLAAIAVLAATIRNGRKIESVQVLVNGRMAAALERIQYLEQRLGIHPDDPIPHGEPGSSSTGRATPDFTS
jgi:hypothetical protein